MDPAYYILIMSCEHHT